MILTLAELKEGDVVQLFTGGFGTALVCDTERYKFWEGNPAPKGYMRRVHFYRPYAHTCGAIGISGCIPYVGIEQFWRYASESETIEVLSRNDYMK